MNPGKVCRTCLLPGESMASLFDANVFKWNEKPIAALDALKIFTNIMISFDDGFPNKICYICLEEIQRIYFFKMKCEQSDAILRKMKMFQAPIKIKEEFIECQKHIEAAKMHTHQSTESSDIVDEEWFEDDNLTNHVENINELKDNIDFTGIKIKEEPELNICVEEEYIKTEMKLENQPNDEIFECSDCPFESLTLECLQKHVLDQHTKDKLHKRTPIAVSRRPVPPVPVNAAQPLVPPRKRKQTLQCSVCSIICPSKCRYDEHMRMHTGIKPYKCDICSQSFRFKFGLKNHVRTKHAILDSDEKSELQCSECLKIFGHKSGLLAHMRVHTGDLPFKCDICPKSFRYKSNLITHNRINHTVDAGNKNEYTCEICSKIFTCISKLLYHSRSHTKEKPFKCEICSKTFRYTNNLKVHKREKHNDQSASTNNLQCEICSIILSSPSKLVYHMKSHCDEKPFKCDACAKTFRHKHNLKRHKLLNPEFKCAEKS